MTMEEITTTLIAFARTYQIPPVALMGVGSGLMALEKGIEHTITMLRAVADEMEAKLTNTEKPKPQLGMHDWCE